MRTDLIFVKPEGGAMSRGCVERIVGPAIGAGTISCAAALALNVNEDTSNSRLVKPVLSLIENRRRIATLRVRRLFAHIHIGNIPAAFAFKHRSDHVRYRL